MGRERPTLLGLLVLVLAVGGPAITAGEQERGWDAVWSRCEPSTSLPFRRGPVSPSPQRLFEARECNQVRWLGGFIGSNDVAGTCFDNPREPGKHLCPVVVYPGDRLCKQGYKVIGFGPDMVLVDAPAEHNNCWRTRDKGRPAQTPRKPVS